MTEITEIPALKQIVEGAILAADQPLSIDQMISLFEKDQPSRAHVRDVLKDIEQDCEGRGFELKQVASGFRFQVRQVYGEWVSRLWDERPPRYSRALLETLALIAYKQPITRGDIEEIRGVAVSTNIMRSLLEREWVRVVGHRDVPGRPAIYATTKIFLDYFNLNSLEELPTLSDIKDLGEVNEELNLEEEIIEIRSLELEESEQVELSGIEDEDLEKVTEQVNAIQDNIRNLFAADEEEADLEDEDGLEDSEEGVEEEVVLTEEASAEKPSAYKETTTEITTETATESESEAATTEQGKVSTNIHALDSGVPRDILNAAFAEEDEELTEGVISDVAGDVKAPGNNSSDADADAAESGEGVLDSEEENSKTKSNLIDQ